MSEQQKGIVYFVGAGPGDPELITVKGMRLLKEADLVLYAGSLVNVELLKYVRAGVPCYDTAGLTLEETMGHIRDAAAAGKTVVRLHTGDPSLYGAIQEQIEAVNEEQIPWEIVPGAVVFSCSSPPGQGTDCARGTQTVIITRQGAGPRFLKENR